MIGADLHTAAMLGVGGAAGSGWERRGATQWPLERSNSGLNMCYSVCVSERRNALSPGVL